MHTAAMPRVKKTKAGLQATFLREWRKFRNLTQEKAAEPLQIDATTLSRIERGLSPYDQRFLEAAAKLYRCETHDLLVRDPHDSEEIWATWSKLKPLQRRQAIKILKALEDTTDALGKDNMSANFKTNDLVKI